MRPCPVNSNHSQTCYRCGRSNHNAAICKFKDAQCRNSGKTRDIAPACRSKPSQPRVPQTELTAGQTKAQSKGKRTHHLKNDNQLPDDNANSSEDEFGLHRVDTHLSDPIIVSLSLTGHKIDMEMDTGAVFSLISEVTKQVFGKKAIHSSNLILRTYTDECMKDEGTLNVKVQYGNQTKKLMLVILKGNRPSLLGRNWLKHIQLDWHSIFTVRTVRMKPLNELLQKNETLFSKELEISSHLQFHST